MLLSKAEFAAKKILLDSGLDDITSLVNIDLKDLIQSRGAFYEEADLSGKDGRIVTHENRSIITIDSKITDRGKKRFTAAHELGHFELHKNLAVIADTQFELCNWYQTGGHEKEANEFASELLMPSLLFTKACKGKKFNQTLLYQLSDLFAVSKTATILKFLKAGNHPIMVVCTQNNRIKWWKMAKSMEDAEHPIVESWKRYLVKVTNNLSPPADSVVGQLFKKGSSNEFVERVQEIEKSVWFVTRPDYDAPMFEFCHYVPSYQFALSVIWED
jgi:Zn-dependent peptidase ImmA (M78 family)